MDGHKESILTLKNYGFCHKKKGNFEEARNLFEKAERVAEIELDKDHKWKIMVKIQQALLYEKEGKKDQMEEALKGGLQMCYRLGQTAVEKHGSDLLKILNRHPNSKLQTEVHRLKTEPIDHEGLSMGKRLKQPIDEMGNRDKIHHPQSFPGREFPRNLRGPDGRSSRGQ
ncbi:uncharacterized protein LOC110067589 [Orbicella faveolata]|uniref:uncharacterized protein LOC110067589 n=1 Tax=Orbicella faveolata TaxID=48498 RepID=UPI0009E56110|nr:uncharacterized protein LOC110067589 [Orbicella faveolata]